MNGTTKDITVLGADAASKRDSAVGDSALSWLLRDGVIAYAGRAKDLINNPEVLASYLGR